MQRLISLFQRPDEFEFVDVQDESYPFPWLDAGGEDGEPQYFVQLMQYLRDRRENAVREGSD